MGISPSSTLYILLLWRGVRPSFRYKAQMIQNVYNALVESYSTNIQWWKVTKYIYLSHIFKYNNFRILLLHYSICLTAED